jgi:hypothetical protein
MHVNLKKTEDRGERGDAIKAEAIKIAHMRILIAEGQLDVAMDALRKIAHAADNSEELAKKAIQEIEDPGRKWYRNRSM